MVLISKEQKNAAKKNMRGRRKKKRGGGKNAPSQKKCAKSEKILIRSTPQLCVFTDRALTIRTLTE